MMAEREKVIKGLEAHVNPESCETCAGEDCPYYNEGGSFPILACSSILAADALALIKDQAERIKGLLECATILSAMPTDDYIKRSDALLELYRNASAKDPMLMIAYRVDLCERIEKIPAADVEPVRHGKWVWHGEGYDCSDCKKWVDGDIYYSFEDRTPLLPVYCPFCGAKMDEEEV